MKKIDAQFLLVFTLFVFLVVITAPACKDSTKKVFCKESSIGCEFQKQFTAIKILKLRKHDVNIDALGNPLVVNRWYVRLNATRVLLPVEHINYSGFPPCNTGIDELNSLGSPLSLSNVKKAKREIQINNGFPLGALVEAEILLTGKNELIVYSDLYQQLILMRQ